MLSVTECPDEGFPSISDLSPTPVPAVRRLDWRFSRFTPDFDALYILITFLWYFKDLPYGTSIVFFSSSQRYFSMIGIFYILIFHRECRLIFDDGRMKVEEMTGLQRYFASLLPAERRNVNTTARSHVCGISHFMLWARVIISYGVSLWFSFLKRSWYFTYMSWPSFSPQQDIVYFLSIASSISVAFQGVYKAI